MFAARRDLAIKDISHSENILAGQILIRYEKDISPSGDILAG